MIKYNKNQKKYHTQPASFRTQEIVTMAATKTNCQPKIHGNSYIVRCTAHDDKNPSLSIGEGADGKLLMFCFAGCSFEEICLSLGLSKNQGIAHER